MCLVAPSEMVESLFDSITKTVLSGEHFDTFNNYFGHTDTDLRDHPDTGTGVRGGLSDGDPV